MTARSRSPFVWLLEKWGELGPAPWPASSAPAKAGRGRLAQTRGSAPL